MLEPSEETDAPRRRYSYGFALRPKWLAIHLLAVLALAVMVGACIWQIDRLHTKQARNRLLDARGEEPVAALESLLRPTDPGDAVGPVAYRVVQATGTYSPGDEVFVRNRSLDGAPGAWVLTPLVTADGTAVVVNRGWVPSSSTSPQLPAGAEAPTGEVTVTGLLMPSQHRGIIGPRDAAEGRLPVLARADLDRLQQQVTDDLYPAYVQLLSSTTDALGAFPRPVPAPEQSEGPHRGYAGQWALFALIWVIGYPLLLRRSARRRAELALGPEPADDDGRPRPPTGSPGTGVTPSGGASTPSGDAVDSRR